MPSALPPRRSAPTNASPRDLRHNLAFRIPLVLFESAADLSAAARPSRPMFPLAPVIASCSTSTCPRINGRDSSPTKSPMSSGSTSFRAGHAGLDRRGPGRARAERLGSQRPRAPSRGGSVGTPPRITSFQAESSKPRLVEALGMRPSTSSSRGGARPAFASSCWRCARRHRRRRPA